MWKGGMWEESFAELSDVPDYGAIGDAGLPSDPHPGLPSDPDPGPPVLARRESDWFGWFEDEEHKEAKRWERTQRWLWRGLGCVGLAGLQLLFFWALVAHPAALRILIGPSSKALLNVLGGPVGGMSAGVLWTVLVQSSSTMTGLLLGLVAGGLLSPQDAVWLSFGGWLGSSASAAVASVVHSVDGVELGRAFAAATVNDVYSALTLFLLIPLELLPLPGGQSPFRFLAHQLASALGFHGGLHEAPADQPKPSTSPEGSSDLLPQSVPGDLPLAGLVTAATFVVLCFCPVLMMRMVQGVLGGGPSRRLRRVADAELAGKWGPLTGSAALGAGAALTFVVQSASIFMASLTPLAAVGTLSLERALALSLGSGLGGAATALLTVALQGGGEALEMALCQLLMTLATTALLCWTPPLRRAVLAVSFRLGVLAEKYRWVPLAWALGLVVVPVLGLLLGALLWQTAWWVGTALAALLLTSALFFAALCFVQHRAPELLPRELRTWAFLPEPLRSLNPYHRLVCRAFPKLAHHPERVLPLPQPEDVANILQPCDP